MMEFGSEEAITWTQFKEDFSWEYSWSLRRRTPHGSTRDRVVGAIGLVDCILGNENQERICATDVARWDTSFKTTTGPKGMVLVHIEGNDGRTRIKRNHQSWLGM